MSELSPVLGVMDPAIEPVPHQIQNQIPDRKPITEAELVANLGDQHWRLNNLYFIQDEKGKKIPFRMNDIQELAYQDLWYMNVVLKSRQHGMTTFFAIWELDTVLFNSGINVGIIAHALEEAKKIFRRMIKFAYDNLPEVLRVQMPIEKDTQSELILENGSSISVGTSMRSGTYQILHVTEFGKICAKYPEKAREIVSGGFQTVHAGQMIVVESTAEGSTGRFYEMCNEAERRKNHNEPLTQLTFQFHFYAWWQNRLNRLKPSDAEHVIINHDNQKYFLHLKEEHGIELTLEQKAWYVMKQRQLGEDMMREHPSTPDEAWKQSVEGAYLKQQIYDAYERGRVTKVPLLPHIPVDTYWDLGVDDETAIWFAQNVGREIHVLLYYSNTNYGLDHYAEKLDELKEHYGWRYGRHVAPHDLKVREWGNKAKSRKQSAAEAGIHFDVAYKVDVKMDGITAIRDIFPSLWFDEAGTREGLDLLENFRKDWDEKNGKWKDKPVKNGSIHCADALQTLAIGYEWKEYGVPRKRSIKPRRFGN